MILIKELCSIYDYIPEDHKLNLSHLHYCLNSIRAHYGKPITITSGYRTAKEHEAIYARKNEERLYKNLSPIPVPMMSWHLCGAAADLADPTGELLSFIQENMALINRLDLYFEDPSVTRPGTPGGWIHCQIFAPVSGKRFYLPN